MVKSESIPATPGIKLPDNLNKRPSVPGGTPGVAPRGKPLIHALFLVHVKHRQASVVFQRHFQNTCIVFTDLENYSMSRNKRTLNSQIFATCYILIFLCVIERVEFLCKRRAFRKQSLFSLGTSDLHNIFITVAEGLVCRTCRTCSTCKTCRTLNFLSIKNFKKY